MAAKETQLSAFVPTETKERLDQYSKRTGIKKSHVIDEALQFHFRALAELPQDIIVPSRIVLTEESGRKVVAMVDDPPAPTAGLRALMKR